VEKHLASLAQGVLIATSFLFVVARIAALHLVGAGAPADHSAEFVTSFFFIHQGAWAMALIFLALWAMSAHQVLAARSGLPFRFSAQQVGASVVVPGYGLKHAMGAWREILDLAQLSHHRRFQHLPTLLTLAGFFGSVGYGAMTTFIVAAVGVPPGAEALLVDVMMASSHLLFGLGAFFLIQVVSRATDQSLGSSLPPLHTATLFGHVSAVTPSIPR
jgi:hypothetical protein